MKKTKFTCIDCSQYGCACDVVNFDSDDKNVSVPCFCPFNGERCDSQKALSRKVNTEK